MLDQNEGLRQYSQLTDSVLQETTLKKVDGQNDEKNSSEELNVALNKVKVELINNKKNLLTEKIKKAVIERIYYSDNNKVKTNFSTYLSQKLGYNFTYMSNVFAKVHGNNIRSFVIETKIDRVKELLVYENLTLTEVAYKLDYSSVAHLSNQFKKVNGLGPTKYLASIKKGTDQHSKEVTDGNQLPPLVGEQLQNPVVLNIMNPETKQNNFGSLGQI